MSDIIELAKPHCWIDGSHACDTEYQFSHGGLSNFAESIRQQERDKLMAEVAMLREHIKVNAVRKGFTDMLEPWAAIALSSTTSADEWLAGKIKEALAPELAKIRRLEENALSAERVEKALLRVIKELRCE